MTAYADLNSPQEMLADARAAGDRLPPVTAPSALAPSIRFEDQPRETFKSQIPISLAAQRIAAALDLHLG